MSSVAVPAAVPPADAKRLARRRSLRLRMQKLIAASYAVDALLLLLFHLAGTVEAWVPIAYAAAATVVCGAFFVVLGSRFPDTRADQNLTGFQLPVSSALQLTFVVLAPQVAFLFLTILFIVFAFAALRFDTKEAAFAWLAMSAGLAVVFGLVGPEIAIPHQPGAEVTLVWLSFITVFGRYVFLGVYGSSVRLSLRRKAEALADSMKRVEELACRDELTRALNRRALMGVVDRQLVAADEGGAFCVALFDLDNFKCVNDTHGHLVGDRVIAVFAQLAQQTMRATDTLGRYGGEEFLAVLPGSSPELALNLVERVRRAVAGYDWCSIAAGLDVRVSAGLTGYVAGDTAASLTSRADRALYQAKSLGRDRVVHAE